MTPLFQLFGAKPKAGDLALCLGEDGAWRLALIDEFKVRRKVHLAAFDVVHPDGTLDICGTQFLYAQYPQGLGSIGAFMERSHHFKSAIESAWSQGVGEAFLNSAPSRWTRLKGTSLPALIMAKAIHRLQQSPPPERLLAEKAQHALVGALRENVALCEWRMGAMTPETNEALDSVTPPRLSVKREPKAKEASSWALPPRL